MLKGLIKINKNNLNFPFSIFYHFYLIQEHNHKENKGLTGVDIAFDLDQSVIFWIYSYEKKLMHLSS